jgi:exopolysaccharide biosynthesis polyprenyl glycosylphosphotransferase
MTHVMLLASFDAFAMFEALTLAYSIRSQAPRPFIQPMSPMHFALLAAVLTPLWIFFFAMGGLYDVKSTRSRSAEFSRIVAVVLVGVSSLIVLDYMRVAGPIFPGRSVPIYSIGLGILLVFLCREFVRWMLRRAWTRGYGLRNVILVGTGPIAQHLAEDLTRPGSGYRILAAVAPDGRTTDYGPVPVYPTLDLALEGRLHVVDEVLQADVDMARADVERLMAEVTSRGLVYRFVPNPYGVYAASSRLGTIAGVPVMDVRLTALEGWGAVYKRTFDVVAVLLIALVAWPIVLLNYIVIKVTEPSAPVFYRQLRLGRNGKLINVWKFRTMAWKWSTGPGRPHGSPADAFAAMGREDLCIEFLRDHKVREDPRITRFGRLLRRTSFDELPQLWNVLRGELSLIGPRPITPEELERYGSQRASFLALKPGITGLWQVSGRNDVSYDERVKLDIFYIENWSVKLDLAILAKTTAAVLARRGAY